MKPTTSSAHWSIVAAAGITPSGVVHIGNFREVITVDLVVRASFDGFVKSKATIPDGVDEAAVRTRLLNEFNLEIGAGLGALAGKVWRIGLMGASSTEKHIELCLHGLKAALA